MCDKVREKDVTIPACPHKQGTDRRISVCKKVKQGARLNFFIILLEHKSELMNRIIKMKMTIKSECKEESE
jgi:hypothetical protein